jgi:Ca-activated chloride channel family protein
MRGKLIFGSLLIAASLMQAAGFPPALVRLPQRHRPQVIRREAELVVLPVTVTNRRGQFVSGLKAEDFRVFENGKLQTISLFTQNDVPVAVGLMVDGSASMNPNRPEVLAAARDFLVSSNPQDQIFVVNFNEKASLGLRPSIPFTSNAKELEAAVLRGPTAGMTALYDATALGLRHLALSTRDKKALIIISDGGDDASTDTFRQVLSAARHSNAIIYSIGIIAERQAQVNPEALRKLARETGGDAFFPKSASDLPAICREIAQDLRDQYTIGYVPSNPSRDGTYRAIRVSVHVPGRGRLTARTRKGYFVASGPAQAP